MASCLASSVLPTPVGPGEQEAARRPVGLRQSGARPLDGARHDVHRLVLAEHHAAERLLERPQALLVRGRRLLVRDAGHPADDALDLRRRHDAARGRRRRRRRAASAVGGHGHGAAGGLAAGASARRRPAWPAGLQPQHRAGLVQDVDGAVRQPVVAQEPLREPGRHLERRIRVVHLVVFLVPRAEALEDLDRLVDRRFLDHHLLQAAGQRPVLLDVLEFLERRRADHAKLAGREHRLDQRRQVHRAARRGAGADGGVDLVDEENRQPPALQRREHRLEALLEVAAEPRARQQRGRVEAVDLGALEDGRARPSSSRRMASPSASAVLPTPASPTNTGLFLRRRQRISSVRCSSTRAADERVEHAGPRRAR